MLQKKMRLLGKWRWAILLWIVIAFLSYCFTTTGFAALNAHAVQGSKQFATTGDWPMYLAGPGRSGYNSAETVINKTSAPNLKLHWQYRSLGNISTQPVVVNGVIYWGSWDGYEHATDLNGNQIWQTFLGTNSVATGCHPPEAGVASIADVTSVNINGTMTTVVYVGGGDANFYALNAATGVPIWHQSLVPSATTPPAATFLWSSPVVYKTSVYMGVSSFGDCPLVQGELVKMDPVTGTIQNVFKNVPDGCIGGAIWSSPTIDTSTGHVFIATGTIHPQCSSPEPYTLSMIELQASDLSLVGSWQLPPSDWIGDSTDFGASPTLFQAKIGGITKYLVGANNKNGKFYAFERGNITNGPIWENQIAAPGKCPLCGQGAISSAGWNGSKLFIAGGHTTINSTACLGSVQEVDPATGLNLWQRCLNDGPVLAPVTLVPGVAIVMAGKDVLLLDTTTGQTLNTLTDTRNNSRYFAGASVSNGILYTANMDFNLYAYGL
jgi:outer membrane protein assembly factor BamB